MEKKITKKDMYTTIITAAKDGAAFVDPAAIIEFCENEIATLDKKAAKARARAAEKRAAGDALTDAVKAVMSTEDFETTADIAARVEFEDATVAKISYRLSQLVKNGLAENTDLKIAGGEGQRARVVKGYRLLMTESAD